MSCFLQTLKDFTVFNEHVNFDEVIQKTYELSIIPTDLNNLDKLDPSFYK